MLNAEKPHALLWCDLESTGLDPHKHHILEIAVRLTRFEYPYEPLAAYATIIMGEGAMQLQYTGCDEGVLAMHEKSGLLAEITTLLAAPKGTGARIEDVERDLLALSSDWPTDRKQKVLLAGNSVHFDLSFLRVHMPTFVQRLSHRTFDASVVYAFCRSMGMPEIPKGEEPAHRAAADVLASLRLVKECREWLTDEDQRNVGCT